MGLLFGKVSKVDYKAAMVDVVFESEDRMVITDIPYLSTVYEMPKIKDQVAVLFADGGLTSGIVLGKPYTEITKPPRSGKGITYKQFSDGTFAMYDPESGTISTDVKKVKVKKLSTESLEFGGARIEYNSGTLEIDVDALKTKKILAESLELRGARMEHNSGILEIDAHALKTKKILASEEVEVNGMKISGNTIQFADGASVSYDASTQTMTASADKVKVKTLIADNVICPTLRGGNT